jgi:hypothetical protein
MAKILGSTTTYNGTEYPYRSRPLSHLRSGERWGAVLGA